jgi:hypothetical protein
MTLPTIAYSQTNTTIEWSITGIKTRNENGRDIIVQLSWAMLGTRLDSTDKPVSALKSGTLVLDYNPANFIDLSALSQTKLVNWVNVKLGLDHINKLREEINVELDSHTLTEQAIPA